MTFKYNNVYINETSTVVGPYENKGPLSKYYDSHYEDLYFNEKTWEQAEIKSIVDSINILLKKLNKSFDNKKILTDINLFAFDYSDNIVYMINNDSMNLKNMKTMVSSARNVLSKNTNASRSNNKNWKLSNKS